MLKIMKIFLMVNLLLFMGCAANPELPKVSIDDESVSGFSRDDFDATLTSDDPKADLRIYNEEDFERLAYYMSIAWRASGHSEKHDVANCLSKFRVEVRKDTGDSNARVFWDSRNYDDPDVDNFLIIIRTPTYEATELYTFAHEFTHVIGDCAFEDGDAGHKNKLLWLRYTKPNNPMAVGIALEASHLRAEKRYFYLSVSHIEMINESFGTNID